MSRVIRAAALTMAMLLMWSAAAVEMVLPSMLTEVYDYAFAGNTAITDVIVPEGAQAIGAGAFSGCENLKRIDIPGSVEMLAEDCLSGCRQDLLIQTTQGSAAAEYARLNNIDYQADTNYRALLIGQVYAKIPSLKLAGPANDIAVMQRVLTRFDNTPYEVTAHKDLTVDGMINAINTTFGDATEDDVSLLFYSGHGIYSPYDAYRGALLGADGAGMLTADGLRAALDQIKGRKIVIIDACFSGNMITAASVSGQEEQPTASEFVDSFISAFAKRSRGNLAGDGYYILTSAAEDEAAYEKKINGKSMGIFTAYFAGGCGIVVGQSALKTAYADANSNGVITLQEIYNYTSNRVYYEGQHAQVYPADCGWFGIFRN